MMMMMMIMMMIFFLVSANLWQIDGQTNQLENNCYIVNVSVNKVWTWEPHFIFNSSYLALGLNSDSAIWFGHSITFSRLATILSPITPKSQWTNPIGAYAQQVTRGFDIVAGGWTGAFNPLYRITGVTCSYHQCQTVNPLRITPSDSVVAVWSVVWQVCISLRNPTAIILRRDGIRPIKCS